MLVTPAGCVSLVSLFQDADAEPVSEADRPVLRPVHIAVNKLDEAAVGLASDVRWSSASWRSRPNSPLRVAKRLSFNLLCGER